jgi:hypothetical protein
MYDVRSGVLTEMTMKATYVCCGMCYCMITYIHTSFPHPAYSFSQQAEVTSDHSSRMTIFSLFEVSGSNFKGKLK